MEILNLHVYFKDPKEEDESSGGILITVLIKVTEEVTDDYEVVWATSHYGLIKGSSSHKLKLVPLSDIDWPGKMLEAKYLGFPGLNAMGQMSNISPCNSTCKLTKGLLLQPSLFFSLIVHTAPK
jgi:hypothetical protein